MQNRILTLGIFLLMACGRQVEISSRELKYNSSLASPIQEQTGTLIRGKPDQLKGPEGTFPISIYSSYASLEFIAARELNKEYPVKFRGKLQNKQYILETLRN